MLTLTAHNETAAGEGPRQFDAPTFERVPIAFGRQPMFRNRVIVVCLSIFAGLWLSLIAATSAGAFQVAQPAEKAEHGQHAQHEHHHLHMPMGEEKCEPAFT